jgi:hypothetical protein
MKDLPEKTLELAHITLSVFINRMKRGDNISITQFSTEVTEEPNISFPPKNNRKPRTVAGHTNSFAATKIKK